MTSLFSMMSAPSCLAPLQALGWCRSDWSDHRLAGKRRPRVRECNTWPLIGYEIRFYPFTDYIEGIGHGRLPTQFRLAFPIERKGDGSRLLVAGCLSGNRLQ